MRNLKGMTILVGVLAMGLRLESGTASGARLRWALGTDAPAAPEPSPAKLPVVVVRELKPAEISELLSYPARAVARVNTTVLAEADGVVKQIHTPLGRRVAARQKILTLMHTDPVYQFAPVVVTSPVAGVVSAVDVTEGSQVTRGQRLATVMDPRQVQLIVEIPATDLAAVAPGLAGQFHANGMATEVPVRVRGVSPVVDPATGTATAELELTAAPAGSGAPTGTVVPGVLGQVRFKAQVHQGFSVPDHALVYRGQDTLVRLLEGDNAGGKVKEVVVTVGQKRGGLVEILRGVRAGDRLIERASRFVANGEAVTAQAAEAGTTPPAGATP
jgi:multidrug efflux pump subunit AcrA (membrane-fusion protein)